MALYLVPWVGLKVYNLPDNDHLTFLGRTVEEAEMNARRHFVMKHKGEFNIQTTIINERDE